MPETAFQSDQLTILRHDFTVTTSDGVALHARRYGSQRNATKRRKAAPPLAGGVLVLPDSGTTIGGLDTTIVALMKAPGGPSKVVTFDRRGHGRSEVGDVDTIGPDSSANDIIAVCDATGLHETNAIAYGRAAFGLLATAPKRPGLLRRFVLNDGGPQLDGVGLARLAALGKRGRVPKDWDDAAAVLRAMTPGDFTALDDAGWDRRARAVWRQEKGRFVPDVDRSLVQSFFDGTSEEVRPFWQELKVLRAVPGLLIRGETSPLVTAELSAKVRRGHGDMVELLADGQGFVPSLDKPELTHAIIDFLHG